MYFKSNYFISAFQSCLSIQANSHLVNSPHFCQQSYQPTNPIFKFVNPVSNPPILDNFPHSKNPRLSFRLRTRPQTTESLYLLILLHPYLSTLDINTTVSTCPEIIQDICCVLGRQDIVMKWVEKAKPCVICFRGRVADVIIDERTKYRTEKSKVYYFYKQALYYIVMKKWGFWDPRFHNPIIRLKDDLNVSDEDIVACYYIEQRV